MLEVVCPYCGLNAKLVDSAAVFWKSYGMIWLCDPCQAWVGIHKDSEDYKPLGTLAKEELRKARRLAHAALDPHWRSLVDRGGHRGRSRADTYRRLADALGIEHRLCHIAQFDEYTCRRVLAICDGWQRATTEVVAQESDTPPT